LTLLGTLSFHTVFHNDSNSLLKEPSPLLRA